MTYAPRDSRPPPPRKGRPWLIASPLIAVLILAALWTAFWFYAAARANTAIAEWRTREAQAGRSFTCASQSIGGFPFRLEVECGEPNFELQNLVPPTLLAAKQAKVVAQVYDPTLLIGEFAGPMLVGEAGKPASMSANWSLLQTSVRGLPGTPERASIVVENPEFSRAARAAMEPVAGAKHLEIHGRALPRAANDTAAAELYIRLAAASAPAIHQSLVRPTDADIGIVVTGLRDLAPKPWIVHLRDLADTKGQIEIKQARLSQADILATGAGALTISPDGLLNGQITLTVVGLDKLMNLLGLEEAVTQYLAQRGGGLNMDRITCGLDRLLPGLGGAVRGNTGNIAAAGIAMLGEPRELEGKKAIGLPLRFADGNVFLGPLQVGRMSPLF